MTEIEEALIRQHVKKTYWDLQKLMRGFHLSLYEPRNPFNFREKREFYIAWRTEWRRVVAEHIAQSAPNESELRDLGLKN